MNGHTITLAAAAFAAAGLTADSSTMASRSRPGNVTPVPGLLTVASCAQHFTKQGNPATSYHYCHFNFALACGPGRTPNTLYAGGKIVDVHPMGGGKYRVTYVCTNSGR